MPQPHRAQRDPFDRALEAPGIDVFTDTKRVVRHEKYAGHDVAHQRLGAETDGQAEYAGARQQRGDIDPQLRQRQKGHQHQDAHAHRYAYQRQQGGKPRGRFGRHVVVDARAQAGRGGPQALFGPQVQEAPGHKTHEQCYGRGYERMADRLPLGHRQHLEPLDQPQLGQRDGHRHDRRNADRMLRQLEPPMGMRGQVQQGVHHIGDQRDAQRIHQRMENGKFECHH